MSVHLRHRLDRILGLVESSKDKGLRNEVMRVINLIPPSMTAINKELLTCKHPQLNELLGMTEPLTRSKALAELERYRNREDLFGQVCDLLIRIGLDEEEDF